MQARLNSIRLLDSGGIPQKKGTKNEHAKMDAAIVS